jgi:hypothetical protein
LSDVGGFTQTGPLTATLTFDRRAPGPIPAPVVSGLYKPSNNNDASPYAVPALTPAGITGTSLAVFDGGKPNRLWSPYVVDDAFRDGGSIAGWSSMITAWIKVRV